VLIISLKNLGIILKKFTTTLAKINNEKKKLSPLKWGFIF